MDRMSAPEKEGLWLKEAGVPGTLACPCAGQGLPRCRGLLGGSPSLIPSGAHVCLQVWSPPWGRSSSPTPPPLLLGPLHSLPHPRGTHACLAGTQGCALGNGPSPRAGPQGRGRNAKALSRPSSGAAHAVEGGSPCGPHHTEDPPKGSAVCFPSMVKLSLWSL